MDGSRSGFGAPAIDTEMLSSELSELRRSRFMISPQDWRVQYWSIFMMALLLFIGIYMPLRVAFFPHKHKYMGLDILIQCCYWIDLALNFFVGIKDDITGEICYHRPLVALTYLRSWFVLDLVATFPWDAILGATDVSRASELLKLLRLFMIIRLYPLFLGLKSWYRGLADMTLLVVMAHVLGCGWYLMSSLFQRFCSDLYAANEDVSECPWVYRLDYAKFSLRRQYLAAVYWALSTLSTVGFGDITAHTAEEQVYAILMEVMGVTYYAVVIGTWGNHLARAEMQRREDAGEDQPSRLVGLRNVQTATLTYMDRKITELYAYAAAVGWNVDGQHTNQQSEEVGATTLTAAEHDE